MGIGDDIVIMKDRGVGYWVLIGRRNGRLNTYVLSESCRGLFRGCIVIGECFHKTVGRCSRLPELADAKCPQCDGIAKFNVAAQTVNCKHCGFKASYDEYIEAMTDRLTTLSPGYRAEATGENSGKDG